MSNISRREFFRTLVPDALNSVTHESGDSGEVNLNGGRVFLGRLGDFPVGTETKFQWQEGSVCLWSEAEGLRIQEDGGGDFYVLHLEKGNIFFCPHERCSASEVLSVMTGEMQNTEGENYG